VPLLCQTAITEPFNVHLKDKLEDRMAANVRRELAKHGHDAATKLLKQYQREFAADWVAAYHRYVSVTPSGRAKNRNSTSNCRPMHEIAAWCMSKSLNCPLGRYRFPIVKGQISAVSGGRRLLGDGSSTRADLPEHLTKETI
jgi:hypothetical protein